MFKIRFHLKNGKNFMHWQITNTETGEKHYINPEDHNLLIHGGELVNSVKTANWIRANNLKQVCAWILCPSFTLQPKSHVEPFLTEVCYNPMRCNHWHYREAEGFNLDGKRFDVIKTVGRKVYIKNN